MIEIFTEDFEDASASHMEHYQMLRGEISPSKSMERLRAADSDRRKAHGELSKGETAAETHRQEEAHRAEAALEAAGKADLSKSSGSNGSKGMLMQNLKSVGSLQGSRTGLGSKGLGSSSVSTSGMGNGHVFTSKEDHPYMLCPEDLVAAMMFLHRLEHHEVHDIMSSTLKVLEPD